MVAGVYPAETGDRSREMDLGDPRCAMDSVPFYMEMEPDHASPVLSGSLFRGPENPKYLDRNYRSFYRERNGTIVVGIIG